MTTTEGPSKGAGKGRNEDAGLDPYVQAVLTTAQRLHEESEAKRAARADMSPEARRAAEAAEAESRRQQQWGSPTEPAHATATKIATARTVLEKATEEAFELFRDACDADRAILMTEITETALAHDALLSGYAQALAQAEGGGDDLAKRLGFRSVPDLLQHDLGKQKRETDGVVRLGKLRAQGDYPALATAITEGSVSLHQALVIVGVLDQQVPHHAQEDIARVEQSAVEFAIGNETQLPLKPEQLQKLVRGWFKELEPERVELDSAEQHDLRECSYGIAADGMVRVRALLPAEEGAQVLQFLDANAGPRVRFRSEDSQDGADPEDTRTQKQKKADAFARAFSVAAKAKGTATQGGASPTLTVTIPVDELDKHAAGAPALAQLDRTQELVPAHVAARILCDGGIRAAITRDRGEVLFLGRKERLFSSAQRTALSTTYPTCAVRDCDIPAVWCESHHVQSWANGGPTDLDNGVMLCNYHHHQVHSGHLTITRDSSRKRWRVRRKARIRTGSSAARIAAGASRGDFTDSRGPDDSTEAKPANTS